jgi:hypothetical protein
MFGVLWLPSLREANQRLIGWPWVQSAYAVTYLVEVVRLAPDKDRFASYGMRTW